MLAVAVLALSDADQHVVVLAVVGLLSALTTLAGTITANLIITRNQTRRLVGDPNGRGKKVNITADEVSLASVAVVAAEAKAEAKAAKDVSVSTDRKLVEHIKDDRKVFEVLIPEHLHEKAGLNKPL